MAIKPTAFDVPKEMTYSWMENKIKEQQAEIKKLNEDTCLLKMITKERDELAKVIEEIEGGDNPDLWGCLVAERDELKDKIERLTSENSILRQECDADDLIMSELETDMVRLPPTAEGLDEHEGL